MLKRKTFKIVKYTESKFKNNFELEYITYRYIAYQLYKFLFLSFWLKLRYSDGSVIICNSERSIQDKINLYIHNNMKRIDNNMKEVIYCEK